MKKITYLFLLIINLTFAQVTLVVTQIPSNTPQNATIYMAANTNSWNAAGNTLTNNSNGTYQIIIPPNSGAVSYKFTRGTWATVEGNATGGFLPNRTINVGSTPQTVNLTIQSWEGSSTATSTAASNVSVINNAFYMPQLNKSRKIWLYLPPDYYTTTKTYPVIYMQDGQNLFDNATSFSGEWQVDETLNTLFQQGNYGAIVVGIDNGGADRLNEYSPWNNPSYGGGQGDLYSAFVAETLKPYIDNNYRTKPQPQFNALIGSSMGALISSYIASKYPNSFQKVGNFSPAFWFARTPLLSYINSNTQNYANARMYFVAGTNEDADMVPDCNAVKNAFQSKQLSITNTLTKYDTYGTHTESYWRGEFSAAYIWLFQNETLSNSAFANDKICIYKSGKNEIFVEGFESPEQIKIYDIAGKITYSGIFQNGSNILNIDLQAGIYIIKNNNFTYKIIL